GDRKLPDLPLRMRQGTLVGLEPPRVVREPPEDGIHAGIVGVAVLGRDVEDPELLGPGDPAPVAVAVDAVRPGGLERLARPMEILAQSLGTQDLPLPVAAAGDLMARRPDHADDLGLPLRGPPEHEE